MSFKLTGIEVELLWTMNELGEDEESTDWYEGEVGDVEYNWTLADFIENIRRDYDGEDWCKYNLIYTNENDYHDTYVLMFNDNDELTTVTHGKQEYNHLKPEAMKKDYTNSKMTDILVMDPDELISTT